MNDDNPAIAGKLTRRTSFEAKMESGKANSFKSPAEAELPAIAELVRERGLRLQGRSGTKR